MTSTERRILENVRKLDRLEKEFRKFTYETKKPQTSEELSAFFDEAMRTATDAFNTKSEILGNFKEVAELTTQDRQALRLLDSLRRGDKLYSIAFYENVVERLNEKAESRADKIATSLYDILHTKFDDLFLHFHSWFDVLGYYSSKIVIGPIIASSKVPSHLVSYFDELRETYAFGQYRASAALCRALLEMALYRKLKARGLFKEKDSKVTSIDVTRQSSLNYYIDMAKREHILSKDTYDSAKSIRKAAGDILHTKDNEKPIDHKLVVDTIFDTIRIIEDLYR